MLKAKEENSRSRMCIGLTSLMFQFGSDMSTGVVVVLVEVEHTVDVQVVLARPRHQHGHDIGGFLGVVDVVHQVTETVNDDKSVALAFA